MGLDVTLVGLERKSSSEHELKKHAATIHCSNTLSLLQRKISNALLYHAYKHLDQQDEYEITVKQLCKLIAYNGNNHAVIKEALKDLLSTVIEWNVVNDTTGMEDWTASSILASVSLQGPMCIYAYSPRMRKLLYSPSMFGKVNLVIQSRFKSSYGLALYENCIRYRGLPYTKWFQIDVFRKLMGVPEGKYIVFRDFKRRVLDKSVEEVNTYSDLFVEADVCREGRHVTKVRFILKERPKKTRLGTTASVPTEEVGVSLKTKLINQFALSEEQAHQVLSEYDLEFIAEKISVIEVSKNYQDGKVHNLAGYFMSALKNNYQLAKTSVEVVKVEKRRQQVTLRQSKKLVEEIREKYFAYRETVIDRVIAGLAKEEKKYFMERFFSHSAPSIKMVLDLQRNKYTIENVIHSPQIKALLRHFALQELPLIKNQLVSLEKFIQNFSESHQQAWKQLHVEI